MYNPKLPMTDIPFKASLTHHHSKDCVTLLPPPFDTKYSNLMALDSKCVILT